MIETAPGKGGYFDKIIFNLNKAGFSFSKLTLQPFHKQHKIFFHESFIETGDFSLKIGFFAKIWLILSALFIKMVICMLKKRK